MGGDLSFLSMGDWGGKDKAPYYTEGQKASADVGLPLLAAELKAKFVLALGDNFYHSGIHEIQVMIDFTQLLKTCTQADLSRFLSTLSLEITITCTMLQHRFFTPIIHLDGLSPIITIPSRKHSILQAGSVRHNS